MTDQIPDRSPEVLRAVAFRNQAAVVAHEVEKLWLMREWGRADTNMDLTNARATLRTMLGEITIADFAKVA